MCLRGKDMYTLCTRARALCCFNTFPHIHTISRNYSFPIPCFSACRCFCIAACLRSSESESPSRVAAIVLTAE